LTTFIFFWPLGMVAMFLALTKPMLRSREGTKKVEALDLARLVRAGTMEALERLRGTAPL
jgi:hypothetical protein